MPTRRQQPLPTLRHRCQKSPGGSGGIRTEADTFQGLNPTTLNPIPLQNLSGHMKYEALALSRHKRQQIGFWLEAIGFPRRFSVDSVPAFRWVGGGDLQHDMKLCPNELSVTVQLAKPKAPQIRKHSRP